MEGGLLSKSSRCAEEQKSGPITTGKCGAKAVNCFLRIEMATCAGFNCPVHRGI